MTERAAPQRALAHGDMRSVSISGSGAYVVVVFECGDEAAAERARKTMLNALATDDIHFVVPRAAVRFEGGAVMMGLTARQAQALRLIEDYEARHGASISLQELADALALGSKSGAHRVLGELKKRGRITWAPRARRSIRVRHPGEQPHYTLRAHVETALRAYCSRHGDDPEAFVEDAVELMLDQLAKEDAA